MTAPSTSRSRDAALRRLTRCNRWLLAGSVTLTGAFKAIAAQAFPGKTRASTSAKDAGTRGSASTSRHAVKHARRSHKSSPAKALAAPAQAPKAASTTTTQAAATPETETATTEQATAPAEAAKTTETQAPESTSTESSPSSESNSAPVVSGGS
jgi:hypothetical protein